ncbi:MAG: toll/interleukin-1 receptor domain-containing protein, partial [Nitrososphaerota archaeon]|nr:toll/interleukin-1 receptor domain-containing protein [Nitrososphaerota archaeon]
MVDEEKEYDLFISYSRKDLQFVERLVKRIESVQLEGRELRCFFAEWDILPGENIVVKLEQGLKRSKFIGLVMSPDWERSDWATLERVIPIYEDPAGYKARVLPILRRGCVIPPSIMILKWFNFQNDTGFEREAERLISRIIGRSPRDLAQATVTGRPLSRQVVDSSSPDFQNETLASNLFPVVRMPSRMFIGHSKVHKRNDVWAELGSGAITPPFAFNEDTQRIYAFSPLSEEGNNLRKIIIESTVEEYRTTDLLADSASIVIEILNRSMTA